MKPVFTMQLTTNEDRPKNDRACNCSNISARLLALAEHSAK